MSRTAALAAALLVLATGCTGSPRSDDAAPASVGDVVPVVLDDRVQGRPSAVVVPGLRYTFTVSRPMDRIDSLAADQAGVDDQAGDGVRFVGITWQLDAQVGDTFVMAPPEDASPALTLLVDGRETPVGGLDDGGLRGAYVAVPADAEEIGYAVEYDGLVQTVDDALDPVLGRADGPHALYLEAPSVDWRYCPERRLTGGDPRVSLAGAECSALVSSRLPYYGPLGWAPAGSAWVVAQVRADAVLAGVDLGDDYVDYDVRTRVGLVLGERRPTELLPPEDAELAGEQEDGSWAATAVFEVGESDPDGPLTVVRRYVGVPEEDDPPAAAPATLRRTVRDELR